VLYLSFVTSSPCRQKRLSVRFPLSEYCPMRFDYSLIYVCPKSARPASADCISPRARKNPFRPWVLSPFQGRQGSEQTNIFGIRRELTLGLLYSNSGSVRNDRTRAMIHRSCGLLDQGKQYGENFYYNEYREVSNSFEGIKAKIGAISTHPTSPRCSRCSRYVA
jgi:hypothetical protein